MRSFLNLVLLFFLPLLISESWAASCCARTPAAPFLIVGDDQAQINFGISGTGIVAQADQRGSVTRHSDADMIWNYRVDGAIQISDLLQVGLSVPVVTRRVVGGGVQDSSTGIGDLRLTAGYEFMPSWSYSSWKPQGLLFTVVTLPTGVSSHQSLLPSLADVTGNGFFAVALGSLFIKRWATWDAFFLLEGHYSFPRTFGDSSFPYQAVPGLGSSLGVGVGYSPGGGNLRMGVRLSPRWDQLERTVAIGVPSTVSGTRWVTEVGADLAYMVATTDTLNLSYSDQTLIGLSRSAPLNRSFMLSYQHRWER